MSTLNWVYQDNGEYHATPRDGYRIRAVLDSDASNPFEDGDCNWPIIVRDPHSRKGFTSYSAGQKGDSIACPFELFNDAQLLHWQIHIAKAFSTTVRDMIECYGQSGDELPEGKVACHDAAALRDALQAQWEDWSDSDKLDLAVELFKMVDVAALSVTVTGYSQGDWAEVLVVATPDEIKRFGCTEPPAPEDLRSTAELYGAWAWGDVCGHIVERWVPAADAEPEDFDPEFDEGEWVELDDGACWGFYGTDFDKSGLEESALSCLPALPLPVAA